MTTVRADAFAKVNLTLHVTGRRDDGYHLLDSLVVFAGIADKIGAAVANDLSISVSGPFSVGVPRDDSNLILRAARALQEARGVSQGAHLSLEKHLPHAAGLGSASSDAAATLKLLAEVWGVAELPPHAPEVVALGADVPVCGAAPAPQRMTGIGDVTSPVTSLPTAALVLANPRVEVATADVFARLRGVDSAPMTPIPDDPDFDTFARWLSSQRNDLQPCAAEIAPQISACIDRLKAMPQIAHAGMSGSGATCYGIARNMADARQAARALQVAEMSWWVAPAEMLQASRATT